MIDCLQLCQKASTLMSISSAKFVYKVRTCIYFQYKNYWAPSNIFVINNTGVILFAFSITTLCLYIQNHIYFLQLPNGAVDLEDLWSVWTGVNMKLWWDIMANKNYWNERFYYHYFLQIKVKLYSKKYLVRKLSWLP